jgi:two-component system sensor histidine kinase SenX3
VLDVRVTPLPEGGSIATIDDITERWMLDQVRTDFVANVSHELKTPVGAISVLAETIEGETEDELVLRLVRRMIIESERMSRTIDELLELSRIEMGGEMLSAPVDLNDVIAEAIDRALPLASRQGVAIAFEKSIDESTINGDHFQLVSAVSNLVDNAVKYSDEGGLVTVSLATVDGSVELQVADQGIGIPMASLDRIFERFYRVDRARSRGTGGTGLGLSIVRHVVTNHGGEVNVRSREGEGSTFILRFPSIHGSK